MEDWGMGFRQTAASGRCGDHGAAAASEREQEGSREA
jgi:hypothetical protein